MTDALDPGVSAPQGDPGALLAAASWHENLADSLGQTASTIEYTTGQLSGTNWEGDAAQAYVNLAGAVKGHFDQGCTTARAAAAGLRRFAHQLERLQAEGIRAVHQTVHWMRELQRDRTRLTAAQGEVTRAAGELIRAQNALGTATALPHGTAVAVAAAAVRTAQHDLTQAQSKERAAQRTVNDDQHQVTHWQTRARQIWQEAENAAVVARGDLSPLTVAPPPLAGAPATFTGSVAADSAFLRAHPWLARDFAARVAEQNAGDRGLGSGAVTHDEAAVLHALETGQSLDGVHLSAPVHHSGGGLLTDLFAGGAAVATEVVGGGPEDPAADGAAAAEVTAIEGGSTVIEETAGSGGSISRVLRAVKGTASTVYEKAPIKDLGDLLGKAGVPYAGEAGEVAQTVRDAGGVRVVVATGRAQIEDKLGITEARAEFEQGMRESLPKPRMTQNPTRAPSGLDPKSTSLKARSIR